MTSTATSESIAPAIDPAALAPHLAPPFYGWATYASPTPPGFWSHQAFQPHDGTLVAQLGRQGAAGDGYKFVAYRKGGVQGGPRSVLVARIEPVSLSGIGHLVEHWAYLRVGGAFRKLRLYQGQPVLIPIAFSGSKTVQVGCFLRSRYTAEYGEVIARVSNLSVVSLYGVESENGGVERAATDDHGADEAQAALLASETDADVEEIPFGPVMF